MISLSLFTVYSNLTENRENFLNGLSSILISSLCNKYDSLSSLQISPELNISSICKIFLRMFERTA